MEKVRNGGRWEVVWESLGSVGEKWRSWWTRNGRVGGDEERVVGDLGKGRVEEEEEESGERWI